MAKVSSLKNNYVQYLVSLEEGMLGFVDPYHHQVGHQKHSYVHREVWEDIEIFF